MCSNIFSFKLGGAIYMVKQTVSKVKPERVALTTTITDQKRL